MLGNRVLWVDKGFSPGRCKDQNCNQLGISQCSILTCFFAEILSFVFLITFLNFPWSYVFFKYQSFLIYPQPVFINRRVVNLPYHDGYTFLNVAWNYWKGVTSRQKKSDSCGMLVLPGTALGDSQQELTSKLPPCLPIRGEIRSFVLMLWVNAA